MDPLEWLHQWDDYEMYMFIDQGDEGTEPGIYMQVSRRVQQQGAEEWQLLYERRLGAVPGDDAPSAAGDWEDSALRAFLKQYPNLVPDEKAHLGEWLAANPLVP